MEEMDDRGTRCVDAAAVGLSNIELLLDVHQNKDKIEALYSIGQAFIKRQKLQLYSMREMNKDAKEPETIEDYLYALTTFSRYMNTGHKGSSMAFVSFAVQKPFKEIMEKMLRYTDLDTLIEGLLNNPEMKILGDSIRALKATTPLPTKDAYTKLESQIYNKLEDTVMAIEKEKRDLSMLTKKEIDAVLNTITWPEGFDEDVRKNEAKTIIGKSLSKIGETGNYNKAFSEDDFKNNDNRLGAELVSTLINSIQNKQDRKSHV